MAILTISREYGSGGWEIGRRVAERLDYQFVDKERVFQDLERAGTQWGRLARELDEVCPTLWERHDWQYRGYVAQTQALVLSYAEADNAVLIGRGASFLLQEVPFSLRVRLVAPLEVRLERIMTRERLDRKAAARLVTQMDGDRACYVKANYGSDWDLELVPDSVRETIRHFINRNYKIYSFAPYIKAFVRSHVMYLLCCESYRPKIVRLTDVDRF